MLRRGTSYISSAYENGIQKVHVFGGWAERFIPNVTYYHTRMIEQTIDAIMSGKLRKDSFGRGGFETQLDDIEVYGDTATAFGRFVMAASQLARNRRTGEVVRRRRTGTFHTTHTWVRTDGRWRMAATHLTLRPGTAPRRIDDDDWVYLED
jgi:hypothetical protein